MTTHYHAVVVGIRASLSPAMQWFHSRYARAFNRRYGRFGSVFAERFQCRTVDEDGVFDRCGYVLANPVKAGLCDRVEDWPWSYSRLRAWRLLEASRSPRRNARGPRGHRSHRLPVAHAHATHAAAAASPATADARASASYAYARSQSPTPASSTALQAPPPVPERRFRPAEHAVHAGDQPLPAREVLGAALGRLAPVVPRGVRHVEHPVVVLARPEQFPRPVEQRHAALPLLRVRPALTPRSAPPRPVP